MSLIQNMEGADKCTKYKRTNFLVAASRGKQSAGSSSKSSGKTKKQLSTGKSNSKAFYKSSVKGIESSSPMGDPSLAPVVINRQLSSLQRDSSSDSSLSDSSEHDLVIDTLLS